MLATIHDDTWNVLNMQHITPNSKRRDYSYTPGGGHKKIKGPAHMVEGGHHLRKAPNPHPLSTQEPRLQAIYTQWGLIAASLQKREFWMKHHREQRGLIPGNGYSIMDKCHVTLTHWRLEDVARISNV